MPLAGQLVHQRLVRGGPLVLSTTSLNPQRLQQIGDQPVSRKFVFCYQKYGLYHHPSLYEIQGGIDVL